LLKYEKGFMTKAHVPRNRKACVDYQAWCPRFIYYSFINCERKRATAFQRSYNIS